MSRKRLLAQILIFILITGIFVGCGGKPVTGSDSENGNPPSSSDNSSNSGESEESNMTGPGELPIVKEKVTLSFFANPVPEAKIDDFKNNDFTKWLEEQTNINTEWVMAPSAEEASSKLSVLINSGEYPDILLVNGFSPSVQDAYGRQGIIIPLNDYIEKYGVEIKKLFAEHPEAKDAVIRSNGKIYCMPPYVTPTHDITWNKMWVYKPFLDALNMDMPTTTDEFYDLLKAIKEGDPNGNGENDEIPLAGCTDWIAWNPVNFLMNSFIYDDNNKRMIVNNGKLEPIFNKEEFKEGLKYISKLCKEGLLDPRTFSQDIEQYRLIADNDVPILGVMPSHAPFLVTERFADFVPIPPLKGPNGTQYATYYYSTRTDGPVITDKCKEPAVAFRLLDFLYTEEASLRLGGGVPGIDWKYNEDQNLRNEFGNVPSIIVLRELEDVRPNSFWYVVGNYYDRPKTSPLYVYYDTPQANKAREESGGKESPTGITFSIRAQLEVYNNYLPPEEIRMPQVILFTDEEATQLADMELAIYNYVNEMQTKFITGIADIDSEWDDYVKQLEQLGLNEMMQMYQAAYDRTHKK